MTDFASIKTIFIMIIAACVLITLMFPLCPFQANAEEAGLGRGLGIPPGSYRITSESGRVEIPFKMFRGDVWFLGRMNGREIRMLIDNGFLWDQLLFFGSERVDSLGMIYDGEVQVTGGGSGDGVPSRTASGITISFPGIEFYDQTAIVTSYTRGAPNMWEGSEGQVSATFLKHFVTEFDFDRMILTLTPPEEFRYRGDGSELPMTQLESGVWSIPAEFELSDGRSMRLDLAMDLGEGGPFQIIHDLENRIGIPEPSMAGSLGFGMSGETLGHYGRLKSVTIGGYKIENIVAGFTSKDHGAAHFAEVTVGLGLLDRFNFIYDYPHGKMYIEPNHRFHEPFEYKMTGADMRLGRDGNYVVTRIIADSPADDRGLTVGDLVSHINGKPAVQWDYWTLKPLLEQVGKVVTFTVLRHGKPETVNLTLRRLI